MRWFNKTDKVYKESFSQSGEDMIVEFALRALFNVDKPTYIDIGAYHPTNLSNTAYFYNIGCRGINIEPNPTQIKEFYKQRKEDINLNIAIADVEESMDYYIMQDATLNTLSYQDAIAYEKNNISKIIEKTKIETKKFSTIIKEYLKDRKCDFLSVDVEGYDLQILKSISWSEFRPKVVCLETIQLLNNGDWYKNKEIITFLENKNYIIRADTTINTIFIDNSI
jgi:FkbM family methyltransferase